MIAQVKRTMSLFILSFALFNIANAITAPPACDMDIYNEQSSAGALVKVYPYDDTNVDNYKDINYLSSGYLSHQSETGATSVMDLSWVAGPEGDIAPYGISGMSDYFPSHHFVMEISGYYRVTQSGIHAISMNIEGSSALFIGSGFAFNCCQGLRPFDNLNNAVSTNGVSGPAVTAEVYMEADLYYPFVLIYVKHEVQGSLDLEITLPDGSVDKTVGNNLIFYGLDRSTPCDAVTPTPSFTTELTTSTSSSFAAETTTTTLTTSTSISTTANDITNIQTNPVTVTTPTDTSVATEVSNIETNPATVTTPTDTSISIVTTGTDTGVPTVTTGTDTITTTMTTATDTSVTIPMTTDTSTVATTVTTGSDSISTAVTTGTAAASASDTIASATTTATDSTATNITTGTAATTGSDSITTSVTTVTEAASVSETITSEVLTSASSSVRSSYGNSKSSNTPKTSGLLTHTAVTSSVTPATSSASSTSSSSSCITVDASHKSQTGSGVKPTAPAGNDGSSNSESNGTGGSSKNEGSSSNGSSNGDGASKDGNDGKKDSSNTGDDGSSDNSGSSDKGDNDNKGSSNNGKTDNGKPNSSSRVATQATLSIHEGAGALNKEWSLASLLTIIVLMAV